MRSSSASTLWNSGMGRWYRRRNEMFYRCYEWWKAQKSAHRTLRPTEALQVYNSATWSYSHAGFNMGRMYTSVLLSQGIAPEQSLRVEFCNFQAPSDYPFSLKTYRRKIVLVSIWPVWLDLLTPIIQLTSRSKRSIRLIFNRIAKRGTANLS